MKMTFRTLKDIIPTEKLYGINFIFCSCSKLGYVDDQKTNKKWDY